MKSEIKVVELTSGVKVIQIGDKQYSKEEVQGFFKRIRELSDMLDAINLKAEIECEKLIEEMGEKKEALRVFMEYSGATKMSSDGITLEIRDELGAKIEDIAAYLQFAIGNPEIIPANGYKITVIKQMIANGIIPAGIMLTSYKKLKMTKKGS